MEYTKVKKVPGLLLFIDFEKAFDSLEWDFLEKCLEKFNFGPDFRRWVNIFYNDVQSCVINNGLCSSYFNIARGVRQGDPLSPYLFVTAVEILAIAIRNQENIKGLSIDGLETKLLQFADDTTAVLSDLDSARALFGLLECFEKASGLKLNVAKTEAMWIGSLQNCENEPLGVKWKTCVKFLGIYITYDVQILVEKNFKQRLKKIRNTINLWKSRGLSIHGKVNIIKTLLFSTMIYPTGCSSVLCTPFKVIKEFNSLVFRFLWNGNDKAIRLSTYAPYDQGGLKMLEYESMVKALRLSWLKRIVDPDYFGFWKSYLDHLLVYEGGLFLVQCNYDINRLTISATFYRELLEWWSKLREIEDPENIYKYILWNNRDIKIDGKSVFYNHFFDNNILYTTNLLYDMTNVESFNVVKDAGLKNSNFLVWTGLRQSVPLKLRFRMSNVENIFDLENFKCRDYYHYLIKQKFEKPNKWAKLREEFNLEDKQLSEAFMMPLRAANEPYLRSFQYKVLNSILYTNELLCKIGYASNPNCSFCHQTIETISHIFFECSFSSSFWNEVCDKILNKLKTFIVDYANISIFPRVVYFVVRLEVLFLLQIRIIDHIPL